LEHNGITVAVVDDDEGVRKSICFILELEGFTVHTFESAAALFAKLANESIDCFIIDLCMPEASGLVLCEQLRVAGVQTPRILIAGNCDTEVEEAARRLGIYRVLQKPFSGEILPRLIHEALARHQGNGISAPN
jgi:two-component system response regulator FixJ